MKRAAVVFLLAFALVPVAQTRDVAQKIVAPQDLQAFQLRAGEPAKSDHTYAEMPAFTWHPVSGATSYDLQLADNRSFSDVSLLYENQSLATPVASVQLQVPWMNGDPYALWVHVRATVNGQTTPWSKPFGFNTGWQNVPAEEPSPTGLIRWTPVEGATSYDVWYMNIGRVFSTLTNVADEREYWTLHPGLAGVIRWRVRAERATSSAALPNGVAITKYGPWSDVFTTLAPGAIKPGPLKAAGTVSDVDSVGPHALMPGFAWTGTDGIGPAAIGQQLWRVYVFSDRRCINQVMVGSITGGPAWAPRAGQSLALPATTAAVQQVEQNGTILPYGSEGATFMADLTPVVASEDAGAAGAAASTGTTTPAAAPAAANGTSVVTPTVGQIELPDSGWPTGRYWWTVVPVDIVDIPPAAGAAPASGGSAAPVSDSVEYHDAELPQDACASGRVWAFGLQSAPVTASIAAAPYVSGVGSNKLVAAAAGRAPKFVQLPLITWQPAIGAQTYEIELSKRRYPWVAAKTQTSVVTSAVLPLTTADRGTWFYRVRGVNTNLPANAQKMTWSTPRELKITGNQFVVLR